MADTLVWITGASSGLGAALAASVPYDDAHVLDISRSGGTPGAEHISADLADSRSWLALEVHFVSRLAEFTGSRAVLIHNAGTLDPIGFAGEVDSVLYRSNVLLNSGAGQVLGHAFLKAVQSSGFAGESTIVMVSSGAASTAYPGWSSYSAGKAALDHWVRGVGQEQRRRQPGTTVLSIAPGVVATPMQERIRTTAEADFPDVARFRQLHDEGQLRAPADAARDLWAMVQRRPESGSVLDVRSA